MWDVAQLEAHWVACMASAGGGGRVTRLGAAQVLTNPASPLTMLNCILLKGASPQQLEGLLDVGRILLASHRRPPALFLSPLSGDLAALEAGLEELGWRRKLHQVVLVRPTAEPLPDGPAPDGASAIAVTEVTETSDLDVWGRLLVEAYEMPAELGEGVRTAWSTLQARYYMAVVDGRPAGTGLTWQQGEIAGLYAGAVLPALRRRGVERATLLRRMADAREAGARLVVLQTEQGSPVEHLCRDRLGFTLAYERSLWLPGPNQR